MNVGDFIPFGVGGSASQIDLIEGTNFFVSDFHMSEASTLTYRGKGISGVSDMPNSNMKFGSCHYNSSGWISNNVALRVAKSDTMEAGLYYLKGLFRAYSSTPEKGVLRLVSGNSSHANGRTDLSQSVTDVLASMDANFTNINFHDYIYDSANSSYDFPLDCLVRIPSGTTWVGLFAGEENPGSDSDKVGIRELHATLTKVANIG